MYREENYMTYVENEGCCCAVTCKLRKRHMIIIIVLLVLAIVSLVVGMYNGLTFKKYSDMALVVGIFFPSIILIFVCVYLAFICGRESYRSSIRSRVRKLSGGNHSRHNKDGLQHPKTNSVTLDDLSVGYQAKVNTDFVKDPIATMNKEYSLNKMDYSKNDKTDYSEAKISRRHFRSLSNSDVSKKMFQNHNAHYKKSEVSKVSYKNIDNNKLSPKFQKYHHEPQHRGFKRSISDTANKNKNTKAREDRYVWNTQSLHKLRSHMNNLNSVQRENYCESSYDAKSKQTENSFLRSNFKTTVEYGNDTRFKEDEGCDQRHTTKKGEYVRPQDDVHEKSCYAKSEVCLYSSSVPSYKCKQTLKFSSFQPDIKDVKNSGGADSFSLSDSENNDSISLTDILNMERQKLENKRLRNSTSEQDAYRLRRKTIYFPSTSYKESTRPSKEYAHEYCRYSNTDSKRKYHLPLRNEENDNDYENNKQIKFHKR